MSDAAGLRVLLIEDSDDDAELVRRELRRGGFTPRVSRVESRDGLERALAADEYDIVVSDHAMPGYSGADALKLVKGHGVDVPFIIVSGAIGEQAAVEAMRAGAHDYIMKDNLKRLVPAVERELREAQTRHQKREAESALEEAQARIRRLAAIVESSDDAIFSLSLDERVVTWNSGAERLMGWPAAEAVGTAASELGPHYGVELRELMAEVRQGSRVAGRETVVKARSGRRLDVSLTVSPIVDTEGQTIGVSFIARDISERKRFERRLRHLADHDPVTGLLNRRRFEAELESHLGEVEATGPRGAVLMLDLDNFKYINDSLGHRAGDEALRTVAKLIEARLRGSDVVARLGGDEFAVLLPETGFEGAEGVASALLEAVREQTFVLGGRRIHVTASVGVVVLGRTRNTPSELLSAADVAMYEAKEAGRDRLSVYAGAGDDATAQMEAGLTWGGLIRRALAEDMFVLFTQPILCLGENTVERHEVLLRMQLDDGELVPPAAFLGTAERFGQIQAVDRWVVSRAIRLLAEMGGETCLEVNLSGRTIDDPELPEVIESELRDTGVDPGRLVLEITETSAIANMENARALAERLRDLGCRFALDDFGAGFSSFWYLKHLPLDYVKIDGDFVRNLPRSLTDGLVVKAMVEIARGLGMKTIAEFVEDDETLTLLREYGVDLAQGYHIGRPRPASELMAASS